MTAETTALEREGAQRAMAVLLVLGKDTAREVIRHFSEQDLRRLAVGARVKGPAEEVLPLALQDFSTAMSAPAAPWQAADGLLRQWVQESLGTDTAARVLEELPQAPTPDEALGPVSGVDAEALAMVLGREQPQTVALVLSALNADKALNVLNRLPAAVQAEVVFRMAKVEAISPELLKEVGQALAAELRAATMGGVRKVEGRQVALDVLRNKPVAEQGELMKRIEERDADLAAELRTKLLTFEDLVHLPDRDIQALLREFDTKVLMIALKGASPAIAAKIFKNMSSRAADMLRDDMAAMGPLRLADVEQAQNQLVAVVMRLAGEGRIRLIGPADKMV
ncbi:MAG: flagellar motor switch protein FliG [Deltaproteobacteria bacterium]|nr:flagellar motor switch protein FliG [Deltaproteobacteria bacterium]